MEPGGARHLQICNLLGRLETQVRPKLHQNPSSKWVLASTLERDVGDLRVRRHASPALLGYSPGLPQPGPPRREGDSDFFPLLSYLYAAFCRQQLQGWHHATAGWVLLKQNTAWKWIYKVTRCINSSQAFPECGWGPGLARSRDSVPDGNHLLQEVPSIDTGIQ